MANPYLDAQKAKNEFIKFVKSLKKQHSVKQPDGRKQLICVDGKFNLIVISAPSNLHIEKVMKQTIKQYNNLPTYILMTRDASEYPDKSIQSYWIKIKAISNLKIANYGGLIVGAKNVKSALTSMLHGEKLIKPFKSSVEYHSSTKKKMTETTFDSILKELGVTSKRNRELILDLTKTLK